MQSKKDSALEAWANTIIGYLFNALILWSFDVPLGKATIIGVIAIFVSTARSYIIRRIFNKRGIW